LRLAVAVRRRSFRGFRRVLRGVIFGSALFRVLQDQLQLLEIKLFRARAVAMAQQPLDQLP
jgi:hypothetical protein